MYLLALWSFTNSMALDRSQTLLMFSILVILCLLKCACLFLSELSLDSEAEKETDIIILVS